MMLLTALAVTKMPQTLCFTSEERDPGSNQIASRWGYAITVYIFDSGKFYIYDNNFPGVTVSLAWDSHGGFSSYTKAAAYNGSNGTITKWGVEAIGNIFENIGFENGDFSGWSHETHTWEDPTPGSFSPEKSEIVSSGDDETIPTIQGFTMETRQFGSTISTAGTISAAYLNPGSSPMSTTPSLNSTGRPCSKIPNITMSISHMLKLKWSM